MARIYSIVLTFNLAFSTTAFSYEKSERTDQEKNLKKVELNKQPTNIIIKTQGRTPASTQKDAWFQSPEHDSFMGHSAY